MAAFQKPITDHGMVSAKKQKKESVGKAEAAGRERVGGERQQARDGDQRPGWRTAPGGRQFRCRNRSLSAEFVMTPPATPDNFPIHPVRAGYTRRRGF